MPCAARCIPAMLGYHNLAHRNHLLCLLIPCAQVVVERDSSLKPLRVTAPNGSKWWYHSDAIQMYNPDNPLASAIAGPSMVNGGLSSAATAIVAVLRSPHAHQLRRLESKSLRRSCDICRCTFPGMHVWHSCRPCGYDECSRYTFFFLFHSYT